MKGLELSLKYYMEYGLPMLEKKFPDYQERIAVGLVGPGSECYGFDDTISTDHDFGPSFCLWLTDEDFKKIGAELTHAYKELPETFMGLPFINVQIHLSANDSARLLCHIQHSAARLNN